MNGDLDPAILPLTVTLAKFVFGSFVIMILAAATVYWALVCLGKVDGPTFAKLLHQADIPKMTTIIMIVCAVSLLSMLRIVEGEAAVALLSAIAGYVLGNRTSPPEMKPDSDDKGS